MLITAEKDGKVNKIETIKVNGVTQTITSKAVDITVPTKTSDLTNDSNFQNQTQVQTAINSAIAGINSFEYQIVTTLPTPSASTMHIIYLKSNSGTAPNSYDEYITIRTGTEGSYQYKMEKIGTTDVDLSEYLKIADLVAITNAEIDTIFNT